jgi:hypothetical protein
MNELIRREGLFLEYSRNEYRHRPGAPLLLMNKENCRIVFRMKISYINDNNTCCFVGWDGEVMYCAQNNFPVEDRDRSSLRVFDDIAAQYQGHFWRIDRVYTLECLSS